MSETPGWTAPVYQSLTEPQLLGGVSSTFLIADLTIMGMVVFWWYPIVLIGAVLYGVAWLGTKYDPAFFEIIIEHVRQHDHYEGKKMGTMRRWVGYLLSGLRILMILVCGFIVGGIVSGKYVIAELQRECSVLSGADVDTFLSTKGVRTNEKFKAWLTERAAQATELPNAGPKIPDRRGWIVCEHAVYARAEGTP